MKRHVRLGLAAIVVALTASCPNGLWGPPSTDAALSSLTISDGTLTPAFDPAVYSYTVTVDNPVETLTVVAAANDANATVTGDGAHTLVVGENAVVVTVVAEDEVTSLSYTITVTREAAGPSAEEIGEAAVLAMTSMAEATASLSGGGGAPPAGVEIDDSSYDYGLSAGTIVVAFTDYSPPDSGVTISGELTLVMMWHEDDDPVWYENNISGSLSFTGLSVQTCTIDVHFQADIGGGVLWDTATWSGTITIDGEEADLDQVMAEYIGYLQG